jgi:sugar-specific transcriptional regulator TrmB
MQHRHQLELERLGLSETEAQIYLTLLKKGSAWKAAAIAATVQTARSTAYEAINSLKDRGLLEAEVGYGGRFSAVPAEQALPHLIAAEQEELSQRQQELSQRKEVASELARELNSLAAGPGTESSGTESRVVEFLRDPRVVAERFARLQHEAEQKIDVIVKAPMLLGAGNPAQQKAQRRGVCCRGLYERAVMDVPGVQPYIAQWVAQGEEARVYDGELPHKLAIFDEKIVLLPLIRPGEQPKTLLVRHAQLAQSLTIAFDHLWDRSEPIEPVVEETLTTKPEKTDRANQRISRNGRRSRVGEK